MSHYDEHSYWRVARPGQLVTYQDATGVHGGVHIGANFTNETGVWLRKGDHTLAFVEYPQITGIRHQTNPLFPEYE